MANNLISTTELIEKANTVLTKHATELNKAATQMHELNSEYKKLPSEYIKALKDSATAEKALNQAKQANIKTSKDLADLRAKEARVISAENNAKKSAIALTQKEIIAKERKERIAAKELTNSKKLASAWNALNKELAEAELKYRNLAVSQGLSNKQTVIAQKQVLKLRKRLDGVNTPIKRFNSNVGNYASGLQNIAGALGWAGVTFAIVNGIEAVYDTIKVYDSLLKSLEKVTESQTQANAEFEFLTDITERYGLNLQATTSDYVKFLASVKSTNLEGKQARKIFDSVAKSAASMGLSAEETSGTLRALNQIISKGKVQAEELRGQLGDRIPGAFQIMARALNKTTAELDEMLKKGELMADEVLPKFAEEMEKSFGVENTDRIDTLTGATNRFSAAWDKLIINIDNGDGIFSNFLKNLANDWARTFDTISGWISGEQGMLDTEKLKSYTEQNDILTESRNKSIAPLEKSAKSLQTLISMNEQALESEKNFVAANKGQRLQREAAIENITLEISKLQGRKEAVDDYIKKLEEEKNSLIDKLILKDEDLKQGDLEKMTIKQLTDLLAKYNTVKGKSNDLDGDSKKIIEGTIEYYQKLISANKKLITSTITLQNLDEKKRLEDENKEYQKQIDLINGVTKAKKGEGIGLIETLMLGWESYKNENPIKEATKDVEALKKAVDNYLSGFSDSFIANSPLSSLSVFLDGTFSDLLENATPEEEFALYFNSIAESAQQAFNFINDLSGDSTEIQLANLQTQYENALLFAGDSTTAQAEIERQYEEERAQIQRKQAQAEKDNALFNIAIDTAQAVVASYAASPTTFGLPFSAFALAAGAAQAALVSSQSIPAFKDGVDNFSGGLAILGDGGVNEYVTDKSGKLLGVSDNKDTLYNLPTGATVHPNYDAFINSLDNELINNNIMPIGQSNIAPMIINNGLTKKEITDVMSEQTSRVVNTINNKKSFEIHRDEKGFNIYEKKKGAKKRIMNARYSGKGISV